MQVGNIVPKFQLAVKTEYVFSHELDEDCDDSFEICASADEICMLSPCYLSSENNSSNLLADAPLGTDVTASTSLSVTPLIGTLVCAESPAPGGTPGLKRKLTELQLCGM